ncbi:hypothetical protein D3C80_1563030 [compost metagenome]
MLCSSRLCMPILASSIWADNCWICCTTARTSRLPAAEPSLAERAACNVRSVLLATSPSVVFICSIAVKVLSVSSDWACTRSEVSSVIRVRLPVARLTCRVPLSILRTIPCRFAVICCMACMTWPNSSLRLCRTSMFNCPRATWLTMLAVYRKGATICRRMTNAAITLSNMETSVMPSNA